MHRLFCLCTLLILAGIPSAEPMADAKAAVGDSVTWTPNAPTSKDQIVFTLFDAQACCCRDYPGIMASVEDTVVYLGFEYDDRPCQLCKCAAIGKAVEFSALQLAAGKYGIYKAPQLYCPPGTACPMIAFMPERVGEITVRGTVSSIRPAPGARQDDARRLVVSSSVVILRIDRAQVVAIDVFAPSGVRDARLSGIRRLDPGVHTFSMGNTNPRSGIAFVRVVGEDFRAVGTSTPIE